MINVSISNEDGRWALVMDGHAQQEKNDAGHDLVCCAASTLAFTLAARIREMVGDGQAHGPVMVFDTGHAEIACSAREYCCAP